MNKRRIIFAAVILIAICFAGVSINAHSTKKAVPTTQKSAAEQAGVSTTVPTVQQFIDCLAIALAPSGQVVTNSNTSIVSIKEPSTGWYVTNLGTPGQANSGQDGDGIVIFHQTTSGLQYILGPGTAFALSEVQKSAMPQAVQSTIIIYNDDAS